MQKHIATAVLLTTALFAASASAQDDGLPPLPPRQHGENHNPKAAKWAELFKTMPDEKTACAGLDVFYGQLAVDYKAKTKDQGAAKAAGVAAIERFAENFVHLRDLPMAFEEVPELVAAARKAGAKDPMLDLVEMLGHVSAGHSYALPCFEAKNVFGVRDRVKAEYREGLVMVMAEGLPIYYASDAALLFTAPASSTGLIAKVDPKNFIDAYTALGAAYAKGPGLQSGLLDCWLWIAHDNLGNYNNQWGMVNKTSVPNMFLKVNDQSVLDKQALFWDVAWDKQAFHPDLISALKAVQTYHTGRNAHNQKLADAEGTFQQAKNAAMEILGEVQFKNDSTNCLLLGWQALRAEASLPQVLRTTLEAGFGPRFLQAARYCKNTAGGTGYQPKKGVALAWVLDEAQASERDEIAPQIAQAIGQFFEILPVGTKNPNLEEWLAIENVWPDLDTVFTRAWASLARRPEHWAQIRARDLFVRHVGMAIAAKQSARVRELLINDAKRPAQLMDAALAKKALGSTWQAALDRTCAMGNPKFGTELTALEESPTPSDEDLAKQIQTLADWKKNADDAATKRHLQRLLTERRFAQGASVDLPFDPAHWNVATTKAGADGLLRANTGERFVAHIPLSFSGKGAAFTFDLNCPANAPATSLRLIPQNATSAPDSDIYSNAFLFFNQGILSSPAVLFTVNDKDQQPNGWYQGHGVTMAKPAPNKTVHIRVEHWNDYQLAWVDNRLAVCFARVPDELRYSGRHAADAFLTLEVHRTGTAIKPEQCVGLSPVHLTPLGASPRPWLPDHFESIKVLYTIKGVRSALPRDPAAEIPDPLPWAKAALARDPGHEVALALLIKAGQGPKWETLSPAIQKRLLAACPVNPELTAYLKPHRAAPKPKK